MHRPLALALALLTAWPASSQSLQAPNPVEHIAILPGWRSPEGPHVAAIDLRLEPGWHTYWRNPGAAGIPPQFDWSGSSNLLEINYEWPSPIVFDTFGTPTIGYERSLLLPVLLTPIEPSEPIAVNLHMLFGACRDICIPVEVRLAGVLMPDTTDPERPRIEAARAERSLDARAGGVVAASCTLGPGPKGPTVRVRITFAGDPDPETIAVIEAPDHPDIWIGTAQTTLDGLHLDATARVKRRGGVPVLARDALDITLLDPARAILVKGCSVRP